MKLLSLPSELQTLWANRRDPRAGRALAEMLWRVFLVLGAVTVIAAWIYAAAIVLVPDDTPITEADPAVAIRFDKKAMSDILDVFAARATKAATLRASPPAIVDPAKPTAKPLPAAKPTSATTVQ